MPKLQGEGWDEWIFRQSVEVGTRNAAHPMLWTDGDRGGVYAGGVRVEAGDSGVKSAGCSNRTTSLNTFLFISCEESHIQLRIDNSQIQLFR